MYAVIFTSEHSDDVTGYAEAADRMEALARKQPGFMGIESVRAGKSGITVSYWATLEAVSAWKRDPEHLVAQEMGRTKWYRKFRVVLAKVEREY